jgi:hypothetical protein
MTNQSATALRSTNWALICLEVLSALVCLHDSNVVRGNLNASNILKMVQKPCHAPITQVFSQRLRLCLLFESC